MRSCGALFDVLGNQKRTWIWQDPERGEGVVLPVQHGDVLVLVDLDHIQIPNEFRFHQCKTRNEMIRAVPSEALVMLQIILPASLSTIGLTSSLRFVLMDCDGRVGTENVPGAMLERLGKA